MKRSDFIKTTTGLVLSTYIPSSLLGCVSNKGLVPLVDRIGIQLYSVKEQLAISLEDTLIAVAQAGFKHVETFGWKSDRTMLGRPISDDKNRGDVSSFQELLKEAGLTSNSGHYYEDNMLYNVDWDMWKMVIKDAKKLNQSYLIIPGVDVEKLKKTGGVHHLVDVLNKAGQLCLENDIKLAYHNHAFEFEEKVDNLSWMEILMGKTNPKLVDFQTDIFWVRAANVEPMAFLKQYANRIKLWHVKDYHSPDSEHQKPYSVTLGTGEIPYNEILSAPYTDQLVYPVYEQEYGLTGDDFGTFLKQSYDFMVSNLK